MARASRPLTELAAIRASDRVPLWSARDGEWQTLQACPIVDPDPSITGETHASVPVSKRSRGRPKTISDEVREHICLIARTSPSDWKITAFSTWSLSKLADHSSNTG
ncbi:helix-turn-helix domain-containing protein [Streptomyces sp. NPDC049597]|uniref:helix-turn-helix domain-containing protein n=1 Tax=Streptomyces sp. NPDC049597 TaxID=3155276 RepID=UPI0034405628